MLFIALVYTNNRFFWIIFPLINIQYSFHLANKGSILFWRNFPFLFQPWFYDFFLSTLPIVEGEMSSIILRVTTRSRIRLRLHLAYPSGGVVQAILVT